MNEPRHTCEKRKHWSQKKNRRRHIKPFVDRQRPCPNGTHQCWYQTNQQACDFHDFHETLGGWGEQADHEQDCGSCLSVFIADGVIATWNKTIKNAAIDARSSLFCINISESASLSAESSKPEPRLEEQLRAVMRHSSAKMPYHFESSSCRTKVARMPLPLWWSRCPRCESSGSHLSVRQFFCRFSGGEPDVSCGQRT